MIKTIHIFTEEPSAKRVFDIILPKILPEDVYFRVYPHQGKQDLEKALRTVVPSISRIPGSRILITRDQDSANCKEVKEGIRAIIGDQCQCDFFIRIICKELESWFLGDLTAIENAYPRFKADTYIHKTDLRNVDAITQPSLFLLRIIPEFSDRSTLPKLEVSESISHHLDLTVNTSISFKHTINAIKILASK